MIYCEHTVTLSLDLFASFEEYIIWFQVSIYVFQMFKLEKWSCAAFITSNYAYVCQLYPTIFSHTVVVTSLWVDFLQITIYWGHEGPLFAEGSTESFDFAVETPEK